jgi:sugar O-acyltransferase (sialic acid O-acetyltransferase NeuD family)
MGPSVPFIGGWPELEARTRTEGLVLAMAFGANGARLEAMRRARAAGATVLRVVDPSAVFSSECLTGDGVVVLARGVVGPGCNLGEACIINAGAVLPHDDVIGEGAHVAPGAVLGGHVSIGARTLVGLGAVVRDRVKVGRDCVVGAGAVVVNDVPDGATVVGVPARLSRAATLVRERK